MDIIETLVSEHRLIERVIDAFEMWSTRMAKSDTDERNELRRFVIFLREFVEPVHYGKEEDVLFAKMIEHGFSGEDGPVATTMQQHQECRALVEHLAVFARGATPWNESDKRAIAGAAESYVGRLRQHIQKEEQGLFPMSQIRLSRAAHERIETALEIFETRGESPSKQARLLELAEYLVSRYGPPRAA